MAPPQAKLQFVATGDDVVNAQVQAVIDKLAAMKTKATEASGAMSEGMLSTKEDVRAVGEALGTSIPRPLANVISQFQMLQGILAGAGMAGALVLAVETVGKLYDSGKEVYDKWLNIDKAVDEYNKSLGDAVTKSALNVKSLEEAGASLVFMNEEAAKYEQKREKLNKQNKQTSILQDPLEYFFSKADEKDAATGQLTSKLEIFNRQKAQIEETGKVTESLIGQEKALNDIRLEGLDKILADEQSDNALADAKLATLRALANLENERRREYNAANPTKQVALIPDNTGQLEHDSAIFYDKAVAAAKYAAALREASNAVQTFHENLANLRNEATAGDEIDLNKKDLDDLDSSWQKRIRTTMEGSEKELEVFRKLHIDTANMEAELDDTLLALYQAYMTKKDALVEKQRLAFLRGGLSESAIPKALFVTNDDEVNRSKAVQDINLIVKALQDETAQEVLLKDRAEATGETQIDLENQQYALRIKTATQVQGLVSDQHALGVAMHDGIGDPATLAEASKFEAKLDTLRVKTQSWQKELKKTIFGDLESGFAGVVSGTETVSQAFQKMGQDIIASLAKVIFQLYMVKLLQSAIGGLGNLFGGGGSGGGSGQIFDSSFFPNVTPHAMGGSFMAGQTLLVGERGPELVNFGTGGSVTPNNRLGGGAPPVQVNIHNYGQPMEQQQSSHFDGQQYVVDVVIKDIQSNGPIRQALR